MNIEQIKEKFKGAYIVSYEVAQKNEFDQYMSHRNDEDIPLVCQELNVLTVEDYDKWYGLYYLMKDPDTREIMLVTLAWGDILVGIDNEFYPDSVIKFCLENNLTIDPISLMCITKSLLLYDENLCENHLANLIDINKCQSKFMKSIKSKSRTFWLDGRFDYISGHRPYHRMNNKNCDSGICSTQSYHKNRHKSYCR